MDNTTKKELLNLYSEYKNIFDNSLIADLGSYYINGSISEIFPTFNIINFDILEGKNVDICIEPGKIPKEHEEKYDMVISTGSFMCCKEPELFRKEITDLLKKKGFLLLTTCTEKCKKSKRHKSSPNKYYPRGTYNNWEKEKLENFFNLFFNEIKCYEIGNKHKLYVYIGTKK